MEVRFSKWFSVKRGVMNLFLSTRSCAALRAADLDAPFMTGDGPKMVHFWTKNDQTWQACQHSKVVQKGPKGTKMVNLNVVDPLGPICTLLDHFKQKLILCSEAPPPNPTSSILGRKFIFVYGRRSLVYKNPLRRISH